jgi:hypothetical protein
MDLVRADGEDDPDLVAASVPRVRATEVTLGEGLDVLRARPPWPHVQFRLADAASRAVKTYSGGMRRRLDLAASLTWPPAWSAGRLTWPPA